MTKKKPTKKDIETVISNMINHLGIIEDRVSALDGLFGLYMEWNKHTDDFNKFVEGRLKEHNDQILNNEPGETK